MLVVGLPAAQLVGWRRGQTAAGGSVPRWSTGKPQVVTRRKKNYCSCSCRTLVLCTTMLKSFPRPSFLDCTRGSVKPLNRKVQFSSKKLFEFQKKTNFTTLLIYGF